MHFFAVPTATVGTENRRLTMCARTVVILLYMHDGVQAMASGLVSETAHP
jgi:hypothetical protein